MCTKHDFHRDRTGDRLSTVECDRCGHLILFDDTGRSGLSETDLEIADVWYKALVTGRASQSSFAPSVA